MKLTAIIIRIPFWPLRLLLWTLWFPVVGLEYLGLAIFHGTASLLGRILGTLIWLGTMYVVGIVGINRKNEPNTLE